MTPTRPYFLRAIFDWIADNGLTPHLSVDATIQGAEVPEAYVEDGQITLNLSEAAVIDLQLENDFVSFQAKFNGIPHHIYLPMAAIQGIYAKENGQGMLFPDEPSYLEALDEELDGEGSADFQADPPKAPRTVDNKPKKDKSKGSHLRVVK